MSPHSGNTPAETGFHGLGIAPAFLEILARMQFVQPTPIQRQSIPVAIQGKDVVGIAQTGTGKTLAFGIPMIQRLAQSKGQGLVVLPTRELALQVDEMLHRVGDGLGLRTAVLIGGMSLGPQVAAIRQNPHIVIATPGRLIDHLNQKTVLLDRVQIAVLDEADRMLDMGFAPQIQRIFQTLPRERQTMLFSATMPPEITAMATRYMKLPIRVEIAPPGTTAERVSQELFIVQRDKKLQMLERLLTDYQGSTLVFSRTKHGARKIARAVRTMGHTSAELHANRSLNQRREALDGFKTGKYRVLIATDIASRGIDVTGIELVINYDVPTNAEDYVHRIGRTARAGAGGHAITLATPEERGAVRDIERLTRKALPISAVPELPPARALPQLPPRQFPQRRGQQGRRPPVRPASPKFQRGEQAGYRPQGFSRGPNGPRPQGQGFQPREPRPARPAGGPQGQQERGAQPRRHSGQPPQKRRGRFPPDGPMYRPW
ncbi:DEAD/DEAH box helicase [Candidatus Parcubacteria bacterium]|nr:MAG: DEAD/DEAH box helicase [Candidatus Parcubacteria bacterium]